VDLEANRTPAYDVRRALRGGVSPDDASVLDGSRVAPGLSVPGQLPCVV